MTPLLLQKLSIIAYKKADNLKSEATLWSELASCLLDELHKIETKPSLPLPISSIPDSLPSSGYVRINAILKVIPVGKSTWWAGVKSGKFPKPIKLGSRTTAWKVEEIRDLIKN